MVESKGFKPQTLSVIGQGKLGAPIAACLAMRGFEVVGVDSDADRVARINQGLPVVEEPGYPEVLTQTQGRLSATTSIQDAVKQTDASLIIVPTPSGDDGGFVLDVVLAVCEQIGQALKDKDGEHLVVVTSTVMPGHTQGPVRELLEKTSGKTIGDGLLLCYSPEFVALGSVVNDFLKPGLVLIGQADDRSGAALEAVALQAAETNPPVARLSLVDAEIAKIAVNTYVTTKITYANMLAGICMGLPGANVDAVTSAIGLDPRIGSKYLKGGTAYGGPCFPRDNQALALVAERAGADAALPNAVDQANHRWSLALADKVLSVVKPGQTVGVLGLSYKPFSDVTTAATGVVVAERCVSQGVPVIAFDPMAKLPEGLGDGGSAKQVDSLDEVAEAADVLLLATPWPVIVDGLAGVLAKAQNGDAGRRWTVVDGWRVLDAGALAAQADVWAVGVGPRVT